MGHYVGIDAGSTFIKIAIINNNILRGYKIAPSGIASRKTAKDLFNSLLNELRMSRSDVVSIVSTGYGRRIIDIADETVTEIKAHTKGAMFTAPDGAKIRTIIDVGGQDSKVIILNEEREVKNFVMNDKCAAGTGRYIEVLARTLETTIDKIGPLSLQAKTPCQINSLCTVFAESEVISLLARGKNRADIIAGIHKSLVKRICVMAMRVGLEPEILLTGGGALNSGLIAAFEDEIMMDIHIARNPQFNGAIGAALIASNQNEEKNYSG